MAERTEHEEDVWSALHNIECSCTTMLADCKRLKMSLSSIDEDYLEDLLENQNTLDGLADLLGGL